MIHAMSSLKSDFLHRCEEFDHFAFRSDAVRFYGKGSAVFYRIVLNYQKFSTVTQWLFGHCIATCTHGYISWSPLEEDSLSSLCAFFSLRV